MWHKCPKHLKTPCCVRKHVGTFDYLFFKMRYTSIIRSLELVLLVRLFALSPLGKGSHVTCKLGSNKDKFNTTLRNISKTRLRVLISFQHTVYLFASTIVQDYRNSTFVFFRLPHHLLACFFLPGA